MIATRCTTLVIGGGCSGALTAHHLLRTTDQNILLVDPGHKPARGLAYSTTDHQHLLNSRAIAMSVDSSRPTDFIDWAHRHGHPCEPTSFLPRRLYGDYLAAALHHADDGRLHHIRDTATRLHPTGTGIHLRLRTGTVLHAEHAVLATGHAPPTDPPAITPALRSHPRYIANPWTPGALHAVPTNTPVLLLGTGLTAVDVALTLSRHPRTAPIHAHSRRGLLPQAHVLPHAPATPIPITPGPLRHLIRQIRTAATHSDDWRAVIDGLRPHTNTLWQHLTDTEQRRFIRHAARTWETHRHRMAPPVAARIAHLRDTGQLHIGTTTGRLDATAAGITADGRTYGAVINCTGPGSALRQPLIRALIADRHAQPNRLGLGLDVDNHGALTGDTGIHVVGPARRGHLWETTAVPEIRAQAETLTHPAVALSRAS